MVSSVRHRGFVLWVAVLVAVLAGCGGGGGGVDTGGGGSGELTGVVVKGAVTGATVTAYKVDAAGVRGASLGSGTTEADGTYRIALPAYNGGLEVAATGGTYTDEALQMPLSFTREMKALVPDYRAGAKVSVTVSPVSSIAAALARYHVAHGTAFATAVGDAYAHVNAHFGAVDWRTVRPASLNSPSVSSLSPEAVAGLVLAGLSQQSKVMAQESGLTPGTVVSSLTLAEAMWLDAMDGTLDGVGPSGLLKQGTVSLDNQTARRGLGQAMMLFLGSSANATVITASDGQTLAGNVAADADPYLFCPNQTAQESCAGSSIDLDAPTVAFVQPAAGAGVTGTSVVVEVTASDASSLARLAFTAPAVLVPTAPVLTTTSGHLQASFDVSAMADGPLTITVEAEDVFHNKATKSLQVVVANHGPSISISSPSANAAVAGSVSLQATASPQTPGAVISSLVLVDAPAGVGADTSAAADTFTASWNTTTALEGPVVLTFQATDSYGSTTQKAVTVQVDNVPAGVISVALSAGAPVPDATVKVVALDPATGLVRTDVGVNGVLGQGGPTDASGKYDLVLTAENYRGPVKVIAAGTGGVPLFYVDPTNPSQNITIPASMSLTSVLADYQTGTAVTVPVSLWTTLADTELQAYVQGNHRKYPTPHTVAQAVAFADHLFSEHMTTLRPAFPLRSSVPASLTTPPTKTLSDQVYAAMPDVALNQLAHDVGIAAGLGSSGVITAASLVGLLQQDLLADGQFDGFGAGGQQLATPGSPPYSLDANLLRVGLANGLDEFISGSRNMTGLTRQNLDNAGVYNNISQDVSDLFAGAAPQPFDNKAPTVAVAATYGPSNASPVGGGMVVSGIVHLSVVASDSSGIGTISVTANGASVPGTLVVDPAPGTGATFTADFASAGVADGALIFAVTAADKRFNSGVTSYSVTVDNTPPAITVTNPTAANFYSVSLPLEATAADANGVASLTETVKSVSDQDAGASRFFGSWAITAGTADGATSFTYRACDVVQNCATQAASGMVDRTAPTITLAQTVPAYVNTPTLTLVVSASDAGAGVSGVVAQVPGNSPVAGTFDAGTGKWTLLNVPLFVGANSIQVWGIDKASPQNGGPGSATVVNVTQANVEPAPLITAKKSYSDERGITLASAAVPPVYTLASATKVAVTGGSDVYKVSSRLTSAGLTPAILEGANPDNIPYVQIQVPFGMGTAAVQAASYSVTVKAASTAAQVYTGDLLPWKSPASTASGDLFDLPLSADLFPELKTGLGALTVTIDVTITDRAGQVGTLGATALTFHTLPAPLFVIEDTNYASYGDTRSAFAYKLSNNTYMAQWDPSQTAFFGGQVRLLRYIVSNPTGSAVAITPSASGTWTATEGWTPFSNGVRSTSPQMTWWNVSGGPVLRPGQAFSQDGFTFYDYWDQATANSGGTLDLCQAGQPWFNCTTAGQTLTAHVLGDTTVQRVCLPTTYYSAPTVQPVSGSTAPLAVSTFAAPQQAGGEVVTPATVSGAYVVPAASGAIAGSVVVYVARPVSAARALGATWNSLTTSNRYENLHHLYWVKETSHSAGAYSVGCTWDDYRAYKGARWLTTASDSVSGSVTFTAQATTGAALVGEQVQTFTTTLTNRQLPGH